MPDPEVEERWTAQMRAAQEGDAEAYRDLLRAILPVVERQVRAKLFDGAGVDDVVQNALLAIHRARSTYRPERPFGPWMRAIVRNATIDHLRQGKRRRDRETGVEDFDLIADPSSGGEPESNELSPDLAQALGDLPASQREAVEMIHLEGLSVAEAAARAGVSSGALKVRAHRGYRALRERLGPTRDLAS